MFFDKAEALRRAPLFRSLSDNEAARLGDIMADVQLAPGEILFKEGEHGDCFFVVLEGQVEVVKALGSKEERRLSVRGPGDFFGETSLLDPVGLRTATVRGLALVRLLSLSRRDFLQLLQNHPSLAVEIVRVLTLQLRDTNDATIADLRRKNQDLSAAYAELKAAQAQLIEKEKLEQELRTARRIQQSILPGALPRLTGYDFGATFVPARSVGGDLYDFIALDQGRVGIAVGDVSDKGVPAAIFMALTRSLLRAEATRAAYAGAPASDGPHGPVAPVKALERVNSLLLDMNEDGMFVTALYGILDGERGVFTYARAGHEVPIIVRARRDSPIPPSAEPAGSARFVAELEPLGAGSPLGLFDATSLDEQTVQLFPGDTLLLYTDGATDITDGSEALYGMERLQASACAAARHATAQAFCDEIWSELAAYRGTAVQADDVALVALRRM